MVPVQIDPAQDRTVQATTVQIATEGGPALAELDGDGAAARFLLVLTHGAGGSAGAPDLLAARDAARPLGGLVARVTQPYRVRGARAPGSPVRQDAAWAEVVAALRELRARRPADPGRAQQRRAGGLPHRRRGGRPRRDRAGVPAVPAGALTRGVQGSRSFARPARAEPGCWW